jgi:hypothetical protein
MIYNIDEVQRSTETNEQSEDPFSTAVDIKSVATTFKELTNKVI